MKNAILSMSAFIFALAFVFSSCSNSDDDVKITDPDQNAKVSSYTLEIAGITATEVVGEIIVCPDGYFGINGKAPDGTNIAITSSKIMIGETRDICSIKLESEDFIACVDNGGFNIGGLIANEHYSPVSGTATRTSTNDIEVSGVLMNINDLSEHAFSLVATAGLVSPYNCE